MSEPKKRMFIYPADETRTLFQRSALHPGDGWHEVVLRDAESVQDAADVGKTVKASEQRRTCIVRFNQDDSPVYCYGDENTKPNAIGDLDPGFYEHRMISEFSGDLSAKEQEELVEAYAELNDKVADAIVEHDSLLDEIEALKAEHDKFMDEIDEAKREKHILEDKIHELVNELNQRVPPPEVNPEHQQEEKGPVHEGEARHVFACGKPMTVEQVKFMHMMQTKFMQLCDHQNAKAKDDKTDADNMREWVKLREREQLDQQDNATYWASRYGALKDVAMACYEDLSKAVAAIGHHSDVRFSRVELRKILSDLYKEIED